MSQVQILSLRPYERLVKWLRHCPFTAETWVRLPYRLPNMGVCRNWQTRQTQNLLRKRVGSSPTTPTIIYAISSVGKSIGFLIRRSKVRVLYGVPLHSGSLKVKRATYNRLMYGSSPTQSTNMAGWQSPVYCTSLENWQPSEMAVRGFKSHPCRH